MIKNSYYLTKKSNKSLFTALGFEIVLLNEETVNIQMKELLGKSPEIILIDESVADIVKPFQENSYSKALPVFVSVPSEKKAGAIDEITELVKKAVGIDVF